MLFTSSSMAFNFSSSRLLQQHAGRLKSRIAPLTKCCNLRTTHASQYEYIIQSHSFGLIKLI